MANKNSSKSRASKNTSKNQLSFFGVFLFSLAVCAFVWILLAFVFSLVISTMKDGSVFYKVFSPLIPILSLAVGGFTVGKTNRTNGIFLSLLIGVAVLGIAYGLSTLFDLNMEYGAVIKTVIIVVMLVSPMFGAKIATRKKKSSITKRRNVKKM